MRIALIGYGKMGKTIEKLALEAGDEIVARITEEENDLSSLLDQKPDVAIEFTGPESAYENIALCIEKGIPCVSGTTGWLDRFEEITKLTKEKKGAFFYASNFSLGVNLFFHFNEKIADVMKDYPEYNVHLQETHHIHKKDAPSGTAITTAEGILAFNKKLEGWNLNKEEQNKINIIAHRLNEVPGTHEVHYDSEIDHLELKHEAKSRLGFASGALMAAKWLVGKQGVFGMKEMLKLE